MHRINSRVSDWVAFAGITTVMSMMGAYCFAQEEGREPKNVTITATVSKPPLDISLKEALESFPQKVAFNYDYARRLFTTEDKPFILERTLGDEINVTIETSQGLRHSDPENVSQVLTPVVKVGDATISVEKQYAKWCGAGETPFPLEFAIQETEQTPAEGEYSGDLGLVFEPSSQE